MAGRSGRISVIINSPLREMLLALRGVPTDVRTQVGVHTKRAAEPIWTEETRGRATTRLQTRTLVNSARVGVTTRNVFLRSGSVGRLSSGPPVSVLSVPAEWGANPAKQISSTSKKGKAYKRRLGNAFGAPRRGGHVVHPAARDSIPRFAALWVQTAARTILDAFDGKR